jgi:hypothetical protein
MFRRVFRLKLRRVVHPLMLFVVNVVPFQGFEAMFSYRRKAVNVETPFGGSKLGIPFPRSG